MEVPIFLLLLILVKRTSMLKASIFPKSITKWGGIFKSMNCAIFSCICSKLVKYICKSCGNTFLVGGARWLSGRVSDSGARGPGFEIYRRRVVSLSRTLNSPKVLVNYPGSGGSVPT